MQRPSGGLARIWDVAANSARSACLRAARSVSSAPWLPSKVHAHHVEAISDNRCDRAPQPSKPNPRPRLVPPPVAATSSRSIVSRHNSYTQTSF